MSFWGAEARSFLGRERVLDYKSYQGVLFSNDRCSLHLIAHFTHNLCSIFFQAAIPAFMFERFGSLPSCCLQ